MGKILFYTKCRPQDCDIWPIAKKNQRAFIGYPVYKRGVSAAAASHWRKTGICSSFANIATDDWKSISIRGLDSSYKRHVTMNMNIVREIDKGSVVLIPRPQSGYCYAGEVVSRFELIDTPTWADDYFNLRREKELETDPEINHIGDIIQSWKVKKWKKIPFPGIPRWISYRLLSRNTVGVINDLEKPTVSAVDTIRELMKRPVNQRYQAACDGDLEFSLLNWTSPSIFEHLLVDLLQLEAPAGIFWHHVGGCGDGGVDALAVDLKGNQVGVLQCKWFINQDPAELAKEIRHICHPNAKIVIAALHGAQENQKMPANSRFIGLKTLATLVKNNANRIPFAISLGIR